MREAKGGEVADAILLQHLRCSTVHRGVLREGDGEAGQLSLSSSITPLALYSHP